MMEKQLREQSALEIHKQGFTLIVVMFLCFTMTLLALTAWRKASLKFDLVLAREKQYKRFYLAELI